MIVRIKNALIGFIVDSVSEVASIAQEAIEQAPEVVNLQVKNNFIQAVGKYDDKMIFILKLDLLLDEKELAHLIEIRKSDGLCSG
jgi:purine-binding chemotaxis protein CheW